MTQTQIKWTRETLDAEWKALAKWWTGCEMTDENKMAHDRHVRNLQEQEEQLEIDEVDLGWLTN